MWSWKIYAANLTFSSVVGFPIYCESEISAQHFTLLPVPQDHRLNKPIAVFRVFRTEDTSWPIPEQLISFSSLIQASCDLQCKMEGNHQLLYIIFSPPKFCPLHDRTEHLCCHRDRWEDTEYSMCAPQDLLSICSGEPQALSTLLRHCLAQQLSKPRQFKGYSEAVTAHSMTWCDRF